ncbi:MAG TPA: BatD family protein, partial [Verrucomicrobiae bacterium]|nr:BatD family protein [Verrucomicrobiae bacterium]
SGMTGFGQTQINPPATRLPPSSVIRVIPRTVRPGWDPFDSLISSAASFDMDSPVEAHAEFNPPVAAVGERVVYRVVVTALDESLKLPEVLPAPNGLEVHAGGRGQIYQPTGNNKLRPQTTVIFHVMATTNGTFTMPSFEVMAYGKPVKVPETSLGVVPAGDTTAGHEPLRLLVRLPEGDTYVGQTIKIPLILPDPGDGTVHGMSQPGITGEFIFSEPFLTGLRSEMIQHGDKTIPAFVQELTITPMREGPQTLVAQANAIAFRPVPGQTNGAMQPYPMLVDSDPFTLQVKPLPVEGRLPGFTGAVGEFQIEPPKLSTNEVHAGEPLTVTVILRGEGNMGRLTPPPPPSLRDWQTFPPISDSSASAAIQRFGFASFSYPLIPLSDEIKSTPAIPFSYFDPKKKAYVDLTIPAVPITVKSAATGKLAQAQPPSGAGSGLESDDPNREKALVMTGLAETPGKTVGSLRPLQARWWFLALQLLPAAGLGGLWACERRRRHLAKHPEIVLKRRARRGLRRELRRARRAAAAQDANSFVTGAINALREACAPHGAANPEALVCADVLHELPVAEQQGRAGETVRRLFTAADALRFGGQVREGSHLLTLKPELERVLDQLKMRL